MLESPGHSFSDVARKVVSIINLASVRAIENMVGAPVHPLRFRANLYVEGWPAWHEFDLLDQTLAIGDIRLKVVKRIVRCAAVNVDPDTAQRDLAIPQALQRRLGHADCGIYAEVITGGTISAERYDRGGAAGVVVNSDLIAARTKSSVIARRPVRWIDFVLPLAMRDVHVSPRLHGFDAANVICCDTGLPRLRG